MYPMDGYVYACVCTYTQISMHIYIYTYFPIRSLKKNPEYFIEGNELHIQL